MIPTITRFTKKILEMFPSAEGIILYVDDASYNKAFDSWTVDVLDITVHTDHAVFSIDPEERYELFGKLTYVNLGKNNTKRRIDNKHVFVVDISTKLETFKTKDGKNVQYYPSSSEIITDKVYIQELRDTFASTLKYFSTI